MDVNMGKIYDVITFILKYLYFNPNLGGLFPDTTRNKSLY